jgi:hypothetical protein
MNEKKPLPPGDWKCCDICMESFHSAELTSTGGSDDLVLCIRCLEVYELSL